MKNHLLSTSAVLALTFLLWTPCQSQTLIPETFENFSYRNVGAFRTGCWVSDITAPENPDKENQYTFYVAFRAGGVWKTINNGTTFTCISDDLGTTSIGVVEVCPQDPNRIWIGTGEAYNARSSYAGNGIYLSNDGGETWEEKGLKDSHHINRIIIHPDNPDIVYVAAMGHLFSDNDERGVMKTIDQGKTWEKVFYINDHIGVIDLCMNRDNPEILYAATYEKTRNAWTYEPGGPGSRIYKTIDGGANWTTLTNGLPEGDLGRIGIDIHRANPDILYAVIQNLNPDPEFDSTKIRNFDAFADNTYDALIGGEVYRSDNGGDSWRKTSNKNTDVSGKAGYSFNQLYADPTNPDHVYIVGVSMFYSHDGGKTWPMGWRQKNRFLSNFGDVRCFWIDPKDNRHMMLGSDGGIYSTWDSGLTMHHYYHIPTEEVYDVEVDNSYPYNIYVGLQDHETWKGPSNNWSGSIGLEEWVITGMWDGMYTKVDPDNNRYLYFTTQFGAHHRVDQHTGKRTSIAPKKPENSIPYRYTWTTPLELSPHNPAILYTGGQKLLRSMDRGDHWEEISNDLTTNDPDKINGQGHMQHCTISTISESPVKAGIIWVGTDDGQVHVTTDHGAHWTNCTSALINIGAPMTMWVSRVITSEEDSGTAYICKSGYREDIFKPYVYRTDDYGATWTKIINGLPEAPVSVLCEDPVNPALLYAGTDQGVFISFDRGQTWLDFSLNMPPAPVRDLLVHPREKDLIVGTYGRGTFVVDVSPLSEFSEEVFTKDFHLFKVSPKPQNNTSERSSWGNYHMMGDNHLRTPNEANGLEVYFYFAKDVDQDITLEVLNISGVSVYSRHPKVAQGLNKVIIDTRRMDPGEYLVRLQVGDLILSESTEVIPTPNWPIGFHSPGSIK